MRLGRLFRPNSSESGPGAALACPPLPPRTAAPAGRRQRIPNPSASQAVGDYDAALQTPGSGHWPDFCHLVRKRVQYRSDSPVESIASFFFFLSSLSLSLDPLHVSVVPWKSRHRAQEPMLPTWRIRSSARTGAGGGGATDSSRAGILATTSTSLYRIAQRVQIKRQ
ncbi:hypothetical protein LY78DRAFT_122754 [Colletotrichum sublineola]|nr:hypothetical protein LY78DRAFT_122754 [Colletotrichum sublineola]